MIRAYECDNPGCRRLVVDWVLDADREHAAVEDVSLGDRDSIAVGPGERHAQFVLASRELVLFGGAGEDLDVRRPTVRRGRAAQAGLQDVVSRRRVAVEEDHRRRLAFHHRITGQLGTHQRAALEVDVEHQDIGDYTHDPGAFDAAAAPMLAR